MVTVKANGAGDVVSIRINPKAIDLTIPSCSRIGGVGGGQRGARLARAASMRSKMSGIVLEDLGGPAGLLPGS